MTLPSYRDVCQRAERHFSIWGPNSGGGESVVLTDGMLYSLAYGDATQELGVSEKVCAVYTPDEYVRYYGQNPQHRDVVAYLIEHRFL